MLPVREMSASGSKTVRQLRARLIKGSGATAGVIQAWDVCLATRPTIALRCSTLPPIATSQCAPCFHWRMPKSRMRRRMGAGTRRRSP